MEEQLQKTYPQTFSQTKKTQSKKASKLLISAAQFFLHK